MGNKKVFSKRIITFALILFSFVYVNAQTFRCNDIRFTYYAKTLGDKEIQKTKNAVLDSTLDMKFFANDVKVTMKSSTVDEVETAIYEKISDKIYELYGKDRRRFVLKLRKVLDFIKGCEMTVYHNDKEVCTAIYERVYF